MKRILSACLLAALLCSCASATATEQPADLYQLSNKKTGWGQGYHCNEKNQPLSCLEYNRKYGEHAAVFLNEGKDVVLTFDPKTVKLTEAVAYGALSVLLLIVVSISVRSLWKRRRS